MVLNWRDEALDDLDEMYHYIAIENHNPTSAAKVVDTIFGYTNKTLIPFPMRGRKGRVSETRELVIAQYRNYITVYKIIDTEIQIVAVRNTARKWPKRFK